MKYTIFLLFSIYMFTISCKTHTDIAISNDQGVLIYTQKGKKGLVNLQSKQLTPPIYEEISELSEGKYTAGKMINNTLKFGYLNSEGDEITEFVFDDAFPFKDGFSAVKKNDNWNFLDKDLKPISDFKFKMVKDFSNGFAEVKLVNGRWSFINEKGKLITNMSFERTNRFTYGMAMIMENGKYGYIGTNGKIKIQPKFINWREFSEHNVAVVSTEKDGWRIVNQQGDIIPKDQSISVDYPHIFSNGLFRVVKLVNGKYKYGYMNLKEEIKVPIIYDHLEGFHNHNVCGGLIDIDGKEVNCLIRDNGKLLKKTNYSYINYYYKGKVAMVYSKFDRTLIKKLKIKIEDVDIEYITSSGLMGVVDFQGKEVIPTIYKSLSPLYAQYHDKDNYFKNQCLFKAVRIDSKLKGVISDYNEILVPFEYTDINYIYQDAFLVKSNNVYYIYRSKIKNRIPLNNLILDYYTTKQFNKNYIVMREKRSNLVGLMNINGEWLIKPKYEKLMLSEKNYNRK